MPASLSRCIAARGEVQADSAASMVVRTRVYFPIPGGNDSEAAAAVGTGTVVEAAVEVAVQAAVDKRQVAVRNLVDSAADTVEELELALRNSGVDNPAGYIALAVHTPAAVATAGVRWEYDPQSPARQKVQGLI